MKEILLLFVALPLMTYGQTQSPGYNYWDFQLDSISESQFEWDSSNIDNLIWQYGDNQKTFFGDSLNPILVTDTVNMYDTLIDASVDLILSRPLDGSNTPDENAGYVLEFYHKIDTDTSAAGGYFELCLDDDSTTYIKNGDTLKSYWLRFFMHPGDTINQVNYGEPFDMYEMIAENGDTISLTETGWAPTYYYHELYGYHDTLFNGVTGFTGTYDQYEYFFMDFQFGAGGIKATDMQDTLRFRFHFVSDSTSSGKNGWAIKNIKSGYSIHPVGNISEVQKDQFKIFPNPAKDELFIASTAGSTTQDYQTLIYDISGRLIEQHTVNNHSSLNIKELKKGMYLLVFVSVEGELIEQKRFIKQ